MKTWTTNRHGQWGAPPPMLIPMRLLAPFCNTTVPLVTFIPLKWTDSTISINDSNYIFYIYFICTSILSRNGYELTRKETHPHQHVSLAYIFMASMHDHNSEKVSSEAFKN